DAAAMAQQVAEHGMGGADGLLHQQRRSLLTQGTQAQRSGFEVRVDRLAHALQLLLALEPHEEGAQVVEAHACDGACQAPSRSVVRSAASQGARSMPCAASQAGSNSVSA